MNPEHPLDTDQRPTGTFTLRLKRLDDLARSSPRNDFVHPVERLLPARRLAKLLESFIGKRALAYRLSLRGHDQTFDRQTRCRLTESTRRYTVVATDRIRKTR